MNENLEIKWYQTIDSTNTQASREISTAADKTVWIADFQTAGRGQRGNKWESAKSENLTFSILLRPAFLSPAQQFAISQIASLGICRYLAQKGIQAKIKWPNDIYVGDKKICGMLIEHSIGGDKLSGSIVGIGFNLNQKVFASDAPNPTSLALVFGQNGEEREFDRKEELTELLGYILAAYHELEEGFHGQLEAEYTGNLYRLGQFHKFIEIDPQAQVNMPVEKIAGGKEITARIIGVDTFGCAILELENGETRSYPFKGIRYVI